MPSEPPALAARAVRTASATSRAAPRALFAEPLRSRVPTFSGAANGLDTVAISAFHPGVAVPGALLGVAVRRLDGVIDVDERQHIGAGQHRRLRGEPGQQPGGDRVELADMTEGEGAQQRPQRRRRPDPAEQPAHPAVPQHIHVRDRVRADHHPGDQRRHLQVRIPATLPRQTQVPPS